MIKVTFMGHASLIIGYENGKIVTDPQLNPRMDWAVDRNSPGMGIDDLIQADGILISHGHLDHFEFRTLRHFGSGTVMVVPPGLEWVGRRSVKGKCRSLEKWEEMDVAGAKVTAVPVNHTNFPVSFLFGNGSGYIIKAGGMTMFFAGDAAYDDGFGEIGKRYDFDVAFLPIGPVRPAWVQRKFHMDPVQAVKAFIDLEARYMVPIHWGAFLHFFENGKLAISMLKNCIEKEGLEEKVVIIKPWETRVFEPEKKA